jgi:hypothetical protein
MILIQLEPASILIGEGFSSTVKGLDREEPAKQVSEALLYSEKE